MPLVQIYPARHGVSYWDSGGVPTEHATPAGHSYKNWFSRSVPLPQVYPAGQDRLLSSLTMP